MADLQTIRTKLTNLAEEFAQVWIQACTLDNLDPTSVTVELSDDNPYRQRLVELNKQIYLYEHTYRYLYRKNKEKGVELTHDRSRV